MRCSSSMRSGCSPRSVDQPVKMRTLRPQARGWPSQVQQHAARSAAGAMAVTSPTLQPMSLTADVSHEQGTTREYLCGQCRTRPNKYWPQTCKREDGQERRCVLLAFSLQFAIAGQGGQQRRMGEAPLRLAFVCPLLLTTLILGCFAGRVWCFEARGQHLLQCIHDLVAQPKWGSPCDLQRGRSFGVPQRTRQQTK